MDARSIDVLRIMLEHKELNYHEIVDIVHSRCQWKLSEDSTKVIVSNTLKNLVPDFLRRKDLGHKNVRYTYKNPKARLKAESIIHTSPQELDEALHGALKRIKDHSEIDGLVDMIIAVPGGLFLSHFLMIIDAILQKSNEDLIFNKAQARETVAAFWDASVRILETQPLDQLKAYLDSLKKENLAKPIIPTTGVVDLIKFLQNEFKKGESARSMPV